MAEAVLYSFRRCPYAMRARMALAVSEAEYDHREVVLRDKPPQMLEASPKGTVPVFVTEDGQVLEESVQIMRWTLGRYDPEGWLERDDSELVAANDGPFKHHLDRYKYSTRYDDVDPEEHGSAAVKHLQVLDDRLADSPYLCGERRGLADIAIFPFVRQFANADRDWFDTQGLTNVRSWLEGQVDSELFTGIMTKHDQWIAD